jgi:ribosomal protein L31E
MAKEFKEKIITINLRKTFNKPVTKRAKSAQHFLKKAVTKETRIEQIKISNGVNETLWERGMYNCPRRITVKIIADKNIARVYLPD